MKYTIQELKDIYLEASARSESEYYESIAERVERVLKGETKCCRFQLWEKDLISACFVEDDDACIVNGTYDEHVKRYGDHAELVMKMYGVKKAKAQTAVTEEEQSEQSETVEQTETETNEATAETTAEQETVEGISKMETTTETDDSGFEYTTSQAQEIIMTGTSIAREKYREKHGIHSPMDLKKFSKKQLDDYLSKELDYINKFLNDTLPKEVFNAMKGEIMYA